MQSSQDEPMTESPELISCRNCTSNGHCQSCQKLRIPKLFVVADTNVFIDDLKFLDKLKEKPVLTYSCPVIVVPWVVVQELDNLKDGRKNSEDRTRLQTKAKSAVFALSRWLDSRHTCVIGQTPMESLAKRSDITVESNDDRILQCCLQFREKYSNDHVTLLTLDLNLRNKAKITGIDTHSIETLRNWLNIQIATSSSVAMPAGAVGACPLGSKAKKRKQMSIASCSDAGQGVQTVHKMNDTCGLKKVAASCCTNQLPADQKSNKIIDSKPVLVSLDAESQESDLRDAKCLKLSQNSGPRKQDSASSLRQKAKLRKQRSGTSIKSAIESIAVSKSRSVPITVTKKQLNAVFAKDLSISMIEQKPVIASLHGKTALPPLVKSVKKTAGIDVKLSVSSDSTVCQQKVVMASKRSKRAENLSTVSFIKSSSKPVVSAMSLNLTVPSSSSSGQKRLLDTRLMQSLGKKEEHRRPLKRSLPDLSVLSNGSQLKNKLTASTNNVASSKPAASKPLVAPSLHSKSQVQKNLTSLVTKAVAATQACDMNSPMNSKNGDQESVNKIRNCLKQGLSKILETEMMSIFGDLWLHVVLRKPPWTFHQILECLQKHWIAVFGDVWPNNIKATIHELMTASNDLKLMMLAKLLVSSIKELVESGSEGKPRSYLSLRTQMLIELQQIEAEYLQTKDVDEKRPNHSGSNSVMICDSFQSHCTFQYDVNTLAEDRRSCVQQMFQTVWEGILNVQNAFLGALSTTFNETRISVLERFLQFVQSVSAINSSYTSALQPLAGENACHQLRMALIGFTHFNSMQVQPFTSEELMLFFNDNRNRSMLNVGLEQLHSMMNHMSCSADSLLTPDEIRIIQSNT